MSCTNILIIGVGNSLRSDDALGYRFIEKLSNQYSSFMNLNLNIKLIYVYQITIDLIAVISEYEIIYIVDATMNEKIDDFCFNLVKPSSQVYFTTHLITPSQLLAGTEKLFMKTPILYNIQIRGYEWNLSEKLSIKAEQNLNVALNFFQKHIHQII